MHPLLNIATQTAHQAGKFIMQQFDRLDTLTISQKGTNDFVTEVDKAAEQLIIQKIKKAYPQHSFLGEESGKTQGNEEFVWIIDPLDGTTNFIHGFPHFCVSIAFQHKGVLDQAVIYDPLRHEFFTASRGRGALLNDRKLRVSKRTKIADALLATGFPFRHPEKLQKFLKIFTHIFHQTGGIRRAGSAALDLAYVAAGRIDGYWEEDIKPWDVAAGALLIQEAGGLVGDFSGGENYLKTDNIVAGNPKIFKALLQSLHECLKNT